ncbi:phosphosulfolactate synthase [Brevibacillus sp. B_LB10_24]|uniref:phosphosulfolactate synthase n=1 Tax=Brevibacillus TaxID=55080 RepID=UPI0002EC6594|nr:phosphosulfolactate synthase [Brevibacillus massiliensis]
MIENESPFWPQSWLDPSSTRLEKPRSSGLTMVIDKGLGLHATEDLVNVAAPYIDVYKLGFGTSALYPTALLKRKIALARMHHIAIMPGGTFFEIAAVQDSEKAYIERVTELGFTAVEISDGSLPISLDQRYRAIQLAKEAGLTVFTEFGKKSSTFVVCQEQLFQTLEGDLRAGADYVIIEARESGNVGVFNRSGEVDTAFLRDISLLAGERANRLIWEAPRKDQQVALLLTLGLNANLGNIAPSDVLSIETLRRGLRGDTADWVLHERRIATCE